MKILSIEFDSIIRNDYLTAEIQGKGQWQEGWVLSATVEQDDSYIDLALTQKSAYHRYQFVSDACVQNPKGDQTKKVVEDIFGNDLDSFSGYGVEIVKI